MVWKANGGPFPSRSWERNARERQDVGRTVQPDRMTLQGAIGERGYRSSPVFERRRPLLDEGPHAFLLVLGGEERVEDAPLEADPLGQRRLVGAVDAFLVA